MLGTCLCRFEYPLAWLIHAGVLVAHVVKVISSDDSRPAGRAGAAFLDILLWGFAVRRETLVGQHVAAGKECQEYKIRF